MTDHPGLTDADVARVVAARDLADVLATFGVGPHANREAAEVSGGTGDDPAEDPAGEPDDAEKPAPGSWEAVTGEPADTAQGDDLAAPRRRGPRPDRSQGSSARGGTPPTAGDQFAALLKQPGYGYPRSDGSGNWRPIA